MKFFAYAGLVGALCSVGCYAPDDGGGFHERGREQRAFCAQFATCGTCTPVLGCGWCQAGDKGLCADDPNACAAAQSFSWSWESSTCPGAVDGGARSDAATEHARQDASVGS